MNTVLTVIFLTLYIYTLISTISVLLLENRNPVKSLSWMLVLLFLPFVGLFLYLLFGQNFRKQKIISKKSIRKITGRTDTHFDVNKLDISTFGEHHLNLIKLLFNNNNAKGYPNNKIELYSDGESAFDAVFNAIRSAKDHIHLEFYILGDDKISNQLRELLIEKSKEGVRVRMIYDYIGSFDLSKKYLNSLRDAGVYVKSFLPLRLRISRSKINFRNHRKILIVDGKIAFTGGMNVADRYIYGNQLGKWRDTFVKIEGSAVHGLQKLFLVDWYFVERKMITNSKYYPKAESFEQSNLIQVVASGPDTDWEAIMQGITSAIMSATKYIYIHSPYFIPTDVVASAIQMSALSEIDVRIMIPEKSDSKLSDASMFSYLGQMLEAGVRVFIYKGGFLHSKAMVVDDFISLVGSCNMDERSFTQNFEANVFIYSKENAVKLKELFVNDISHCRELTYDEWNDRKRWQKLKESFARLFSPLM